MPELAKISKFISHNIAQNITPQVLLHPESVVSAEMIRFPGVAPDFGDP